VGICELCATIFKDVTTYLGSLSPKYSQWHQNITVLYPTEMLGCLNSLKRAVFKIEKLKSCEHTSINIPQLWGVNQISRRPARRFRTTTNLRWKEGLLKRANPIYLIHIMSVVIEDGLNHLATILTSEKDDVLIKKSRALLIKLQSDLYKTSTFLPMPKRWMLVQSFDELTMQVNTTQVQLHEICMKRNSFPVIFESLGIKDVCEMCIKITRDALMHLRGMIPNTSQRSRIIMVNYHKALVWHLETIQECYFKREELINETQPHEATLQILSIAGLSVSINKTDGRVNAKTLFQWDDLSAENFETIPPETVIQLISIILCNGLSHIKMVIKPKARMKTNSHLIYCASTMNAVIEVLKASKFSNIDEYSPLSSQNIDIVQLKVQTNCLDKPYS
jgi:hypothetical protein